MEERIQQLEDRLMAAEEELRTLRLQLARTSRSGRRTPLTVLGGVLLILVGSIVGGAAKAQGSGTELQTPLIVNDATGKRVMELTENRNLSLFDEKGERRVDLVSSFYHGMWMRMRSEQDDEATFGFYGSDPQVKLTRSGREVVLRAGSGQSVLQMKNGQITLEQEAPPPASRRGGKFIASGGFAAIQDAAGKGGFVFFADPSVARMESRYPNGYTASSLVTNEKKVSLNFHGLKGKVRRSIP